MTPYIIISGILIVGITEHTSFLHLLHTESSSNLKPAQNEEAQYYIRTV